MFVATPDAVFEAIDDLGVTGSHMTTSSAMMMGSKLHLEFLSENKTGFGTKYRWYGRMMGLPMDFTAEVTKWVHGKEKVWETVGDARLIIYSWYRMSLKIESKNNNTCAYLSIAYQRPRGFLNKIISFLFADCYCNWCLKKMLGDAKKSIVSKHSVNTLIQDGLG
jgi:hypothetical protein